jgi:hypothetical protein
VPFRQLNLSTGVVTIRTDAPGSGGNGQVRGDPHIDRSADGSQLFMAEPDISSGPVFTYDAGSDSFAQHAQTNAFYYNTLHAVSGDGSLIATQLGYGPAFFYGISVMDRNFNSVRTFGTNFNGGLSFDPSRDLLYLADAAADQIVAFDTNTWTERFRLNIGESIPAASPFASGEMTVSSDGSELFMSTPSGVRMIDLPPSTGVASQLEVSGFPSFISAGTINRFTVTALDPAGNIDTGFTGTVHFSSSDAQTLLQQDYTFTPADNGTHDFKAVLQSAGTFSITATDAAEGFSASQTGIQVHTDSVSPIPVQAHRDLVYDASRGMLYITTSDGLVERYNVATQTLLAPWHVGASLYGADITPDGAFLYTTEGVRGATQGMIHKVNLNDGTVTNLTYNLAFYEGGTWAITIANNGLALFDSNFEGSGWVPLRQIDLSTDAIKVRTDAPGSGGGGQVRQDTHIRRGADRSLLYLMESNISSGPIFDYDAASDSFPNHVNTQQFLDQSLGSVNRDGSLIAMDVGTNVWVLDRYLHLLVTLPSLGSGLVFDPTRDILYAATTTQILAIDTNTWMPLYGFNIGQTVPAGTPFGSGEMTMSDDGSLLFFSTPTGVRVYGIPGNAHAVGGFPTNVFLASSAGNGTGRAVRDDTFGSGVGANAWEVNGLSDVTASLGSGTRPPAGFIPARAFEGGDLNAAGTGSDAWAGMLDLLPEGEVN